LYCFAQHCGFASSDKATLTKHLQFHVGTRLFTCTQCSFSVDKAAALRAHKNRVHVSKMATTEYVHLLLAASLCTLHARSVFSVRFFFVFLTISPPPFCPTQLTSDNGGGVIFALEKRLALPRASHSGEVACIPRLRQHQPFVCTLLSQ
jgi:hypothetical protein